MAGRVGWEESKTPGMQASIGDVGGKFLDGSGDPR
jgi:hypothetical protein